MTTLTTPADLTGVLRALDAQCEDYQSMYREALRQRDSLRGDDMDALNQATARIRGLVDRVRQRHGTLPQLPELERLHPEVAQRTDALRRTIRAILDLREESERSARALLDDTRAQMRRVGRGRQASRGYRRAGAPPQAARFVDGAR